MQYVTFYGLWNSCNSWEIQTTLLRGSNGGDSKYAHNFRHFETTPGWFSRGKCVPASCFLVRIEFLTVLGSPLYSEFLAFWSISLISYIQIREEIAQEDRRENPKEKERVITPEYARLSFLPPTWFLPFVLSFCPVRQITCGRNLRHR